MISDHQLSNLAKSSFIYGLGNGLTRFISLITLPLFTRYLSPSEFGIIALLGVLGTVNKSIFGLGLGVSTGIVYFEQEEESRRRLTMNTSLVVLLISGGCLLAITGLLAEPMSLLVLRRGGYAFLIVLYIAGLAIQVVSQPFLLEMQYRNLALKFIVVSAGGSLLTVAAMLFLIIGEGRGIQGWVEGWLIGSLITLALCAKGVARNWFSFDTTVARNLLMLGMPLIPSFFFIFVIQSSGTYMLQWFVTPDQIGVYSIGSSLGMALGLATAAFTTAWYPFFQSYISNQDDARPIFSKVLTFYTFGFGILCLLFFLFAKPAVSLLTNERYHSAYHVVGWIAMGQFWLGMWSVLLPGMYFAKETYYVTLIQGVTAVLVVGMNLLWIPHLGIEGAALALATGSFVMVALQQALNRFRNYQVSCYGWERPILLMTVMTVSIIIQWLASRMLSLSSEILASLVILVGYLGFSWLLLTGEERQQVLHWARERLPS